MLKNFFFDFVPKSPTQMGLLSAKNASKKFSRLGTFKVWKSPTGSCSAQCTGGKLQRKSTKRTLTRGHKSGNFLLPTLFHLIHYCLNFFWLKKILTICIKITRELAVLQENLTFYFTLQYLIEVILIFLRSLRQYVVLRYGSLLLGLVVHNAQGGNCKEIHQKDSY